MTPRTAEFCRISLHRDEVLMEIFSIVDRAQEKIVK